jgi:hypothetical protein
MERKEFSLIVFLLRNSFKELLSAGEAQALSSLPLSLLSLPPR